MRVNNKSLVMLISFFPALASGLLAGIATAVIHVLHGNATWLSVLRIIVIAVVCYLITGLVVRYVSMRTYDFAEWAIISVLGSVLFVSVWLGPGVIRGWYEDGTLKPSFFEYVSIEMRMAASVIGFLLLLTLPTSAISAYLVKMIRAPEQ